MYNKGVSILIFAVAFICSSLVSGQDLTKFTFVQPGMGTLFSLTLYDKEEEHAHRLSQEAFEEIERIEQLFSDYRANSYINSLSKKLKVGQSVIVHPEVYRILALSRDLYEDSNGAFDVTIGSLTQTWRAAMQTGIFPKEEKIKEALRQVGFNHLELVDEDHSVRTAVDAIQFDFGGIAKGYAADRMAILLRSAGIKSYLIDAGGDLLIGNAPPGKLGWKIGIENGENLAYLTTANTAIATSGNTYRFIMHQGVKYAHIIDPRTGYGVTHQKIISVYAPTATLADGLASALSILDEKEGEVLIKSKYPEVTYQLFNQNQKTP